MNIVELRNRGDVCGLVSLVSAIIAYGVLWIPFWGGTLFVAKSVISSILGLTSAALAGAAGSRASRWWWVALILPVIALAFVIYFMASATWKCENA